MCLLLLSFPFIDIIGFNEIFAASSRKFDKFPTAISIELLCVILIELL